MRVLHERQFRQKVQPAIETPPWEHALYLTLFVTVSGGW